MKARPFNLVREARAGLIPKSDEIGDEIRTRMNHTARIIRAAKVHLGSVTRVSEEQAITSILADLRHYCDCKGLPFLKLHKIAHALYLEDKADEAA